MLALSGLRTTNLEFAIASQQTQEGNFEETAKRVRSINEMDVASKVTQLLKRARQTRYPLLVARAERVCELLETARRRSDAKRPIQQKKD